MERGCGTRVRGGLYACVGVSEFGRPVEHFLFDPPIRWHGPKVLRAPMLVQDEGGVYHMVMTVGKRYYPFVPDIVEEIARMGLSKRVPRNFDFSILTPYKSTIMLVHPRAIPTFDFKAEFTCKKPCCKSESCKPRHEPGSNECIFALWPLSRMKSYKRVHEVKENEDGSAVIRTPSATYRVGLLVEAKGGVDDYIPGIFAKFYLSHFEYIGKDIPSEIKKRSLKSGFEVIPCKE